MIDTHAHMTDSAFATDLDSVLDHARIEGVCSILTIGINIKDSIQCMKLSRDNTLCSASVGLHPHEADSWSRDTLSQLVPLVPEATAVGETGLDYYYTFSERDNQITVFKAQLDLAIHFDKPLVIHCRDAYSDLLHILNMEKYESCRGVIHCFTGSPEEAEQLIHMGFYLSFGGMLTFKNTQSLQTIFENLPNNRILFETDSPYLSPVPFRGKRNEPAHIRGTYERAAEIWGVGFEDIRRINRTNSYRLFGMGPGYQKGAVVYQIRSNLYINLTNRCRNRCAYCVRNTSQFLWGHHLWLERDPDYMDIVTELDRHSGSSEVVFCGYGEPLLRPDIVLRTAQYLRSKCRRIRINTSGHLDPGLDIATLVQQLAAVIDVIEISLGNPGISEYAEICRPCSDDQGDAWNMVEQFIHQCRKYDTWAVKLSCVTHPGINVDRCRNFAESLGLPLKIRSYRE
jgi:TatD DNase family protein